MNRKEGKKIAVMAAVIMGFMVIAFMPMASAIVTSFTVTPSTGLAGAVDSYDAFVATDGVTSINITIPADFIVVAPSAPGGVLIAEVKFWNSSTKTYYGSATITTNHADPTTKVDVVCELGGEEIRTTKTISYVAGTTSTFESGFACDDSSAIIKLPTGTEEGSINITINCTDCPCFNDTWRLDDVEIAIGHYVRNPAGGSYVFSADDGTGKVDATVEIVPEGEGQGAVLYGDGWWALKYGPVNEIPNYQNADHWLAYGDAGWTPIKGDFNNDGTGDIALFKDGLWALKYGPVNAIDDFLPADKWLAYGVAGWTPVVGDFDNDDIDDIAMFQNGWWALKYGPVNAIDDFDDADHWLAYGAAGWTPVVGDFNNNGTEDIAMYKDGWWALKYGPVNAIADCQPADKWLAYGSDTWTPLVGDANNDGIDDIGLHQNEWWAFKYGPVSAIPDYALADHWLVYGGTGWTPLVGDFGNP
jgi:hypothetical protein